MKKEFVILRVKTVFTVTPFCKGNLAAVLSMAELYNTIVFIS